MPTNLRLPTCARSLFLESAGIAASGQISDWSEAHKFAVTLKGTGSQVAVQVFQPIYWGKIYLVRGRAEPGTTVRVADREMMVPADKAFTLQITAPDKASEITLEAEDSQGNITEYKVPLRGSRGKSG